MTAVVDASAVLTWLQDEPGAEEVEPLLMEGIIGAANWSEVLQKARQHGASAEMVGRLLASFGLTITDVTPNDGEVAAGLWRKGTPLSLADRLCLALGVRLNLPLATSDAAWEGLADGPTILLIR